MAYTFGAGTGDDITWAGNISGGGNNTTVLICGWWRPTTLTAGRGLWSFGNVVGAEIDTTTSELRLRSDNTTDGQWTTTGVGLTVGEWIFLAFLGAFNNTGPAVAWRVWAGNALTRPVEVTVANAVAPVGNNAGNGNFYVGNKGTGTVAFQGDIDWVINFRTNAAVGVLHPWQLAALGAIQQAEADFALRAYVLPVWQGELLPLNFVPRQGEFFITCEVWSGLTDTSIRRFPTVPNELSDTPVTINGATPSLLRGPIAPRTVPLYPSLYRWAG